MRKQSANDGTAMNAYREVGYTQTLERGESVDRRHGKY